MNLGKLKLNIATVVTEHRSVGKIETKDRRGRGDMAICGELKIADFPGLCVASLIILWNMNLYTLAKF